MPNSIRLKFASVIPGLWPTDMRQRFGITLGAKTDRAEMKTTKPRTMRLPRRHDVLILASRVEFRLLVGLDHGAPIWPIGDKETMRRRQLGFRPVDYLYPRSCCRILED